MVMILSATLIPSSAASSGEYLGTYGVHDVYLVGSFILRHNGDVLTDRMYHEQGKTTPIYYMKTTTMPDMDVDELNWLFKNAYQDHIYEAIDKVYSYASLYREGYTWSGSTIRPVLCDNIKSTDPSGYYYSIAADYTYTFDVQVNSTLSYLSEGAMTFRSNRGLVSYICYSLDKTGSGSLVRVADGY